MTAKKKGLYSFILSDEFFDEYRKFHTFITEWVSSLIVLLTNVETPILGEMARIPSQPIYSTGPNQEAIAAPTPVKEALTKAEGVNLTLAQAAVLIIVNFCVTLATIILAQPIVIPLILAGISVVLIFAAPLADRILRYFSEQKETKESPQDLRHWISKSVAAMRTEYTQRRFRIMQQKSNLEKLRKYRPNVNPALYDLKKQSEETVGQKFLSMIDWIDTECNDAAFKRKQFLLSLLKNRQLPQAPVMQR